MEVHHHSHTPRKKWTHYFWEFLMLFLAVTLGFFVENQREHFIEIKREKQYIRSLIIDLKKDTANASLQMGRNILNFKGLDTLMDLLSGDQPFDSAVTGRLYNLSYNYGRSVSLLVTNEITIQQLLNSGNVRLLRKKGVYDSLVSYQLRKTLLAWYADGYRESWNQSFGHQQEIFKVRGYRKIDMNKDTSFFRSYNNKNLQLISIDRLTIRKYIEATEVWRSTIAAYITSLKNFKQAGIDLLALLKQEYHLE